MRKDSLFGKVGLKFTKIDIESVLDFCATKSYELPLNAGFVFELKTSSSF
jgi:hypothetical protein